MKRHHPARLARTLLTLCLIAAQLTLSAAPAGASGFLDWLTGAEPTPEPTQSFTLDLPDLRVSPTPSPEQMHSGTPGLDLFTVEPEPTPGILSGREDVPLSEIEDDGLIRVGLRSLGNPAALTITTAGSYALEGNGGFRFDRGATLRLTSAGGEVWLHAGGLIIDLGESATFTRHRAAAGTENGIYIAEAEKQNLYCGDLTVSAEGDGLLAVLTIGVEEYLYGVVAYEMSDSFPLTALKAQAVAARTYAMRRKHGAGNRAWDVVDTTADQVFKGYDPAYENVIEAVDATRGVVGVFGGGFAMCYYTASNGGQTALASQVWGGMDSDGYLAMQDDPYDLENPHSLQNELTISDLCEGSATLKAMLEEALGPVMAEAGYGEGEWRFGIIEAITPVSPRFEGSRMFEKVRFALRPEVLVKMETTPDPTLEPTPGPAQASASPQPTAPERFIEYWDDAPETYEVELSTYDDIKDRLGLGLNGADYELISVEKTLAPLDATQFTFIMRRFGHGVGMSQRGAQRMAWEYGMSWMDILGFYYPGMSVERIDWPDEPLTELDALPASIGSLRPTPTPRPTPAPLPEPRAGEYYAAVTLSSAASTLNVRSGPSTMSLVLDQLENGRRVIVSGEPNEEGWVIVYTAEVQGYVKAEYLTPED